MHQLISAMAMGHISFVLSQFVVLKLYRLITTRSAIINFYSCVGETYLSTRKRNPKCMHFALKNGPLIMLILTRLGPKPQDTNHANFSMRGTQNLEDEPYCQAHLDDPSYLSKLINRWMWLLHVINISFYPCIFSYFNQIAVKWSNKEVVDMDSDFVINYSFFFKF